jgi:hypothetical protein
VTQNAIPNDPVQRAGGICLGGIGCSGDNRNLLDFMDMIIDTRGHLLVSYADGCIDECVKGGDNSFSSHGSIARQTEGPTMVSAFDVAGFTPGVPPAPAPQPKPKPKPKPLPATGVGTSLSLALVLLAGALATWRQLRSRRWSR